MRTPSALSARGAAGCSPMSYAVGTVEVAAPCPCEPGRNRMAGALRVELRTMHGLDVSLATHTPT